jgi:membrane-associated phospholipid phosphatase
MSARVFPSRGLWIGVGVIAVIDLFALPLSGFRLVGYTATLVILSVCAGAGVLGYLYTAIRPDERLAALCWGASYLITYALVASILSYLVTSLNFPLLDAQFARADAALGFDWLSVLALVDRSYSVGRLLRWIYFSCMPQMLLIFLALTVTRQLQRLGDFLALFTITSLVAIVVGALLPCVGASVYFDPPAALRHAIGTDAGYWHVAHFEALRNGTMRTINPGAIEGLVQFPSFHAALAVITAWAFWRTRFLAYPALVLNAVVVFSAMPIGGHYLVDVIAGVAVAAAAIAALPALRGAKHGGAKALASETARYQQSEVRGTT